jgi:maltooligosyltrehalose trehalohydrolase
MKRKHCMPFGAECLSDSGTRFRLWAPACERIDLLVNQTLLPMKKADAGWFELTTNHAAGSRYQFVVGGKIRVPDPASRFQPDDVHEASEVVDPGSFEWTDDTWIGRRWEEAVIYELHVGAFSQCGTFKGIEEKLDYLADIGVTALELMPVSDFFGRRNWGYDGVLPFAPDSSYGRPDDLKQFVQAAHRKNLMVLLDVVYNHFGPEGNYLGLYAPHFFTRRHSTPWGDAINFDGEHSRIVRDFFISNALYWLEEFHFDGLRLDAVHAIYDDSSPDILTELATTARKTFPDRHIHLVLENEDNIARYLKRDERCRSIFYNAQWNDDIHHVCHVLGSGETDGYYSDYASNPLQSLAKCLTEGFLFQGEPSAYRNGKHRGETSRDLPLTSFVSFLQNHDQIGNRAFGERILHYASSARVQAIMAVLLLAPSPPLVFMGDEFAAATPFLFFCDYRDGLANAVTEGRRAEFARFAKFSDPANRNRIPDPNAQQTFTASKLDWESLGKSFHSDWLNFYSHLLALRRQHIVPFFRGSCVKQRNTRYSVFHTSGLQVVWSRNEQSLRCVANLGRESMRIELPPSEPLYATFAPRESTELPPWSVAWYLNA